MAESDPLVPHTLRSFAVCRSGSTAGRARERKSRIRLRFGNFWPVLDEVAWTDAMEPNNAPPAPKWHVHPSITLRQGKRKGSAI